MKTASSPLVALACLTALTLTGCASNGSLTLAAQSLGKNQAGVTLPDWPPECQTHIAHAPLPSGAELRSILKRERGQLDVANRTLTTCADLYGQIQTKFGRPDQ